MKSNQFPLLHRLLHWGLAFTMLVMLLTVLLRMGWMDKNHMAQIITQGLQKIDLVISSDQAVSIAKSIRGVMFSWHVYFGYSVVFFLLARLTYMKIVGIHYLSAFDKTATLKEKFQAWVYWLFYAGISLSVTTGLLLKFGPGAIEGFVEEIHELALWYFVPFIGLHLAGIIIAEAGANKGIVSKMIGG
jgi:cytochrome b561